MPSGNDAVVYISVDNVRRALETLLPGKVPRATTDPLHPLLAVDRFLINPDLPPIEKPREYAVQQILTGLIVKYLSRLRAAHNLLPPQPHETRTEALAVVKQDGKAHTPALIRWSWLYYRYIRDDLNLTAEEVSKALAFDVRTLRRHHERGLKSLTKALIRKEIRTRQRQRLLRLQAVLPSTAARLIGRDTETQHLLDLLSTEQYPRLLISGAVGTGKTALVAHVFAAFIKSYQLEQIVWLEAPTSVMAIEQALRVTLLPENTPLTLNEYALLYPTALVLDGIDTLMQDPTQLRTLLRSLSTITIVLTSHEHYPLDNLTAALRLGELAPADARLLARRIMITDGRVGEFDAVAFAEQICAAVGGNPLAIRLAARAVGQGGAAHIPSYQGFERLYEAGLAQLSPEAQQLWLLCALFPPENIAVSTLQTLAEVPDITETLRHLLRLNLLDATQSRSGIITLPTAARQFVYALYHQNARFQHRMLNLVDNLNLGVESPVSLPALEHLLSENPLGLADDQLASWARRRWREGVRLGHWARWLIILLRLHGDDPEMTTALGICQRYLGLWDDAQRTFEQVTESAGRYGDFETQSLALLEMTVILRYRGQYEQAITAINYADGIISRGMYRNLDQRLRVEKAQIALARQDADAVLRLLEFQPPVAPILALKGAAKLMLHDYDTAIALGQQALRQSADNRALQARLYTLIGRAYEAQHDLVLAQQAFSTALTLFEQLAEPFALARARSNLGALLILLNQDDDAEQLLHQAEQMQQTMRDREGLLSTRNNLKILTRQLNRRVHR